MKDLTNKTFNSWLVLKEEKRNASNKRMWLCRCTCGREYVVNQANLIGGKSKNCVHCRPVSNFKHGLCENHRLYSTWKSMRTRCNNPNTQNYKYYGGRGITVCKEWDSFETFLQDMENSFQEGLTLDRKDNDGPYCKENCKWSTSSEQTSNQRKSLKLDYQGQLITEAELSRLTGVSRTTIQTRRNKGASIEEMIYGFK